MKNDLISRSALLEEFEWLKMTVGSGSVGDIKDAIERIKKAPAVDAEPVRHGAWKKLAVWADGKVMECTACQISNFQEEGCITNYCPNCGANMDGEHNVI